MQCITHAHVFTIVKKSICTLKIHASQLYLVVKSPAFFDRVTRLPPKNANAPSGCSGARRLAIIIWKVRYVQYLLAYQRSHWSMPYNMVNSGLIWSRVSAVAILGGGWLQSPSSDGPPCVCMVERTLATSKWIYSCVPPVETALGVIVSSTKGYDLFYHCSRVYMDLFISSRVFLYILVVWAAKYEWANMIVQ